MKKSKQAKPKTIVINLFGGAGAGKSTLAAALFYEMKMRGCHVELVREYIKNWNWEGKSPDKWSQPYLFAKQSKQETVLYEKVDFIITDSPLYLIPFYENLIMQRPIIEPAVFNFIAYAEEQGVVYKNYWLNRPNFYDTKGRYQNKNQAKELDTQLMGWLKKKKIVIEELPRDDKLRIKIILQELGVWSKPFLD